MGRPQKKGLDYFPIDTSLFSDIKVRKLLLNKGTDGLSVYCSLLCTIYQEGYYIKKDKELAFIISEELRLKEARVQDCINYCLSIDLLDKRMLEVYGVYTSKGIQARYDFICKQMKRNGRITEYSLLEESSEEMGVSSEETMVFTEEMGVSYGKSAQIKEKENKIKKISSSLPSPEAKVEEGGRGNFCINNYFERYAEAMRYIGVLDGRKEPAEEKIPILRFLTDKANAHGCMQFIKSWPKDLQLYELRQRFEQMARQDQIRPMSFEAWGVINYIKTKLNPADQQKIQQSVTSEDKWQTLVSAVQHCKGNAKVERPGGYIIACLK